MNSSKCRHHIFLISDFYFMPKFYPSLCRCNFFANDGWSWAMKQFIFSQTTSRNDSMFFSTDFIKAKGHLPPQPSNCPEPAAAFIHLHPHSSHIVQATVTLPLQQSLCQDGPHPSPEGEGVYGPAASSQQLLARQQLFSNQQPRWQPEAGTPLGVGGL